MVSVCGMGCYRCSISMSYVLQCLSKYVDVFGEGGGAVVGDFLVYCHGLTVLNIRIHLYLQVLSSWIPG